MAKSPANRFQNEEANKQRNDMGSVNTNIRNVDKAVRNAQVAQDKLDPMGRKNTSVGRKLDSAFAAGNRLDKAAKEKGFSDKEMINMVNDGGGTLEGTTDAMNKLADTRLKPKPAAATPRQAPKPVGTANRPTGSGSRSEAVKKAWQTRKNGGSSKGIK